jgi:hypothetical protein
MRARARALALARVAPDVVARMLAGCFASVGVRAA